MIEVKQTLTGGPNDPLDEQGDCHRACIASILHLRIEDLPNPHGTDWHDVWQETLKPYGIWKLTCGFDEPLGDGGAEYWAHPEFWMAAPVSLNLEGQTYSDGSPARHSVVMLGERVAWDPALNKTYEIGTHMDDMDVYGLTYLIPHRVHLGMYRRLRDERSSS